MSLLFFVLAGMSLSHVLPLVFALVRDTVGIREQGRLIADAVAAGFLGQFSAPFVLSILRLWVDPVLSQAGAAIADFALLLIPVGRILVTDQGIETRLS